MEFKDLIFKKREHGGIGAYAKFKGVTVSIQAGSYIHSRPRESGLDSTEYTGFEVAIWGDTPFYRISKYLDGVSEDDEIGKNVSREDINRIFIKILNETASITVVYDLNVVSQADIKREVLTHLTYWSDRVEPGTNTYELTFYWRKNFFSSSEPTIRQFILSVWRFSKEKKLITQNADELNKLDSVLKWKEFLI